MDRPVVAVVLAGGTGTRLYPASRSFRPKQFASLGNVGGADAGDGSDDRSLLRRTVDRTGFADETYVLTGERYADRVREHAPDAGVLVEPEAKDTGPALVYAAHRVRELVGDCVLVCLPSDHVVRGEFAETMRQAAAVAAETGGLVTIGVEPDRPATGYGYVEPGAERDGYAAVRQFREKPDADTAADLVAAGCYWNAGMFAWTPDALLDAARDSPLAPLVDALDAGDPAGGFADVPAVSVDYAVMEDADDAFVVPAEFDWDDLGSWDALDRLLPGENATLGDALAIDAEGNVLASDDEHVSVVGVDDLVVAAFDDRVLVVPKSDAQRVREVVAELEAEGRF
jgi:mannose-1-phosphate guanylyltransferase